MRISKVTQKIQVVDITALVKNYSYSMGMYEKKKKKKKRKKKKEIQKGKLLRKIVQQKCKFERNSLTFKHIITVDKLTCR